MSNIQADGEDFILNKHSTENIKAEELAFQL